MADDNYRRLGCSAEACLGVHKAQGYCLRHYRQWQRGGIKQDITECAHCGVPVVGKMAGSMYCGARCKRDAWVKASPERSLKLPKFTAIYAGHCMECGASFVAKRKRMYCSASCEPRYGRLYAIGVDYLPPIRTCVHCNCKWSAITRVGPARFCPSPECQAVRARLLRKLRNGKNYARESKRQGLAYEHFDPTEVLARDGWICQLCGIDTPQELRGTHDLRAPELDHRIPRSHHGPHTRANTQCLCRSCNAWKGTRTMEEAMAALVA